MALVFVSIPLMVLALLIATVPGIWAVRIEAAEQRRAERRVRIVAGVPERELPKAA